MDHDDDKQDDAALVALVLAGEREAFGPLLMRFYASIVRLCQRLLGPTLEAQDVAQEAALQAFLNLGRLQEPGRFGAWLHAITANLARSALRRRRTLSLDALGDGTPWAQRSADDLPTPEDAHAAREIHEAILVAIGELSAVNREVVIGFYLTGYSYAELAELLGVPVSTVKGRLFQGRQQLRRTLSPIAQEVLARDQRPCPKEPKMERTDLVEVRIDAVRLSAIRGRRVVVLREVGSDRLMPIRIGPYEATAIALAREGQQLQRPLIHDLTLQVLERLGGQVRQVVIQNIVEDSFVATIVLAQGEQVWQIDARLSDALALAARTEAPILIARAVIEAAGVVLRGGEDPWHKDTPHPRPFAEQVWSLLLELLQGAPGPVEPAQLRDIVWPERFPTRELSWEGQPMLAIRLPDPSEEAWLMVRPAFWAQLSTAVQQIQARIADRVEISTDDVLPPGTRRQIEAYLERLRKDQEARTVLLVHRSGAVVGQCAPDQVARLVQQAVTVITMFEDDWLSRELERYICQEQPSVNVEPINEESPYMPYIQCARLNGDWALVVVAQDSLFDKQRWDRFAQRDRQAQVDLAALLGYPPPF